MPDLDAAAVTALVPADFPPAIPDNFLRLLLRLQKLPGEVYLVALRDEELGELLGRLDLHGRNYLAVPTPAGAVGWWVLADGLTGHRWERRLAAVKAWAVIGLAARAAGRGGAGRLDRWQRLSEKWASWLTADSFSDSEQRG